MELVWSYIVTYCSHLNSGNGCVHGSTLGTVETVVFMVVHWEQWKRLFSRYFIHWEQWKRLCSWYYIGNSGNEMWLWYNIGNSGKDVHGTISIGNSGNGYVHGTILGTVETKCVHGTTLGRVEKIVFTVLYPLGTVETGVLMILHWEHRTRLCSWNYIRNSGNGYVHGITLGTVETKCVHGITLGTVETGVLMVLHWEPWKRLCSRNYIRNSGNDCAHLTTLGTVETIVLMELHSEQFSETMVFMVLHLRTAETIVFIVLRWERRKYP